MEGLTSAAQLDRARAWVKRFEQGWAALDVERLVAPFRADASVLYTGMAAPEDRAGLRGYLERAVALPEMRLRPVVWGASGDDVWIEWEASAEVAGRRVEWRGIDRFRFEGEEIVEARACYDTGPLRDAAAAS